MDGAQRKKESFDTAKFQPNCKKLQSAAQKRIFARQGAAQHSYIGIQLGFTTAGGNCGLLARRKV